MSELDATMQRTLEREDLSIGDRVHLYNQTLQRYGQRLEQYRKKPLGLVDIKQPLAPFGWENTSV
jgi:hypothetical protein